MPDYIPPNQPTAPNPTLQPHEKTTRRSQRTVRQPIPVPQRPSMQGHQLYASPLPQGRQKKNNARWIWILGLAFFGMMFMCSGALFLGTGVIYANGILPGVTVNDVALGGLSESEASTKLGRSWNTITLRDGERTWTVNPQTLGLTLDASATANQAYAIGRTGGNPISAIFGNVSVSPIVSIDSTTTGTELLRIADQVHIAPIDAGVDFENRQVIATPPQNGRSLNTEQTLSSLIQAIENEQPINEIFLVMDEVAPALSDAAPLVAQAQALLSNPLDIRVYDPVTGDSVYWSAMPDVWGQWLTVTPDSTSSIGLALDADPDSIRTYMLEQAANVLDSTRTLDIESGIQNVVSAIQRGEPSQGFVQVQHNERVHTVQAGETITSIAWDYGIPYLYVQNLNDGIDSVSTGQQIRIPPADIFLTETVNPQKRIVVSISQQNVKVYENDQLKWDWVASTGIPDSPTWTGVYQIQSHIDNAYAANWNLYMPNFMGVYQPVPGADFTNGFHGFPTRGGGQLLWENSLGRKVTYGCILLHDTNMQLLYSWAETGVVVEIQA